MGGAFPGPTTNPFDPGRTPGGSSSGSAAVIGACMVPAAIGTQVGGSLIRPASYCGNCALKPTMGALHRGERQGYSQSHVGVHAGSLTDMWRVAMEIARRAGGDPGQPGLFGAPELSPALQPARLIVMETAGWACDRSRCSGSPGTGSSQTSPWREPDSNPRSLYQIFKEERGRRPMALDRAPMPRSTRSPVTSATSGSGQRIEPVDLGVRERFPSLSQFAERAACACDRRCENLTGNLAEKPDQGTLP